MKINFKRGFHRIFLVISILIILIGTAISIYYSCTSTYDLAINNVKVKDFKYKKNYTLDTFLSENGYTLLNYNVFNQTIKISESDELNNSNQRIVDIVHFMPKENHKVVFFYKQWYEYALPFIRYFLIGFIITCLISGLNYGFYALFAWIFSGFKDDLKEIKQ